MCSGSVSGQVFRSLVATGSTPTLIEQCRLLEAPLGTNITEDILKNPESLPYNNSAIRDNLVKADIEACKDATANHPSLSHFNKVLSWMALWDSVRPGSGCQWY